MTNLHRSAAVPGDSGSFREHPLPGGWTASTLYRRTVRAARLDSDLYEEVEADPSAMGQSIAVIAASSIAAGIGSLPETGAAGVAIGTIAAFGGWFVWSFLTYFIGTKILPEPQTSADYGQLLRTIGFSSSPGLIRVFGFIPGIGPVLYLVAAVWMLVAMVIAVRQALDYVGTVRAVIVCVLGWAVQAALLAVLFYFMQMPAT